MFLESVSTSAIRGARGPWALPLTPASRRRDLRRGAFGRHGRRHVPGALRGVPALPGAAVPAAGPAAGAAGRVRAPLRRGADPRDEPVSRRRLSRSSTGSRTSTRTASRPAGIPTRARWPGIPTARGSASPARRRSSTARSMPASGGETHFCDMYGAYERLSAAWKARIANLRAVHNLDFSRTRRHGEEPMTEAQRLRQAAGGPSDRAHASGDRAQVPVSRRPRGIHRSACPTTKAAR